MEAVAEVLLVLCLGTLFFAVMYAMSWAGCDMEQLLIAGLVLVGALAVVVFFWWDVARMLVLKAFCPKTLWRLSLLAGTVLAIVALMDCAEAGRVVP